MRSRSCRLGPAGGQSRLATLDLSGAHPKVPAARFSCMGLLLLINGGRVVAITAESAVIEQQSGPSPHQHPTNTGAGLRAGMGSEFVIPAS
jgi:hypothetical protein